jgi:hypothetical protein
MSAIAPRGTTRTAALAAMTTAMVTAAAECATATAAFHGVADIVIGAHVIAAARTGGTMRRDRDRFRSHLVTFANRNADL